MEPENVWHIQPIPLPVEKTLKSLRRTLQAAEIDIVQQLDLSREFQGQFGAGTNRCILLLVDCPLLLFEAVALDRAAAVFFPLHVVVTGDDSGTSIHWAHPAATVNFRPPATVKRPLDALHARLSGLLGHSQNWVGLRP
jgi:hypothetical protein